MSAESSESSISPSEKIILATRFVEGTIVPKYLLDHAKYLSEKAIASANRVSERPDADRAFGIPEEIVVQIKPPGPNSVPEPQSFPNLRMYNPSSLPNEERGEKQKYLPLLEERKE
jgi:hypothetical protein